jgi:signal transduction histidine kinase
VLISIILLSALIVVFTIGYSRVIDASNAQMKRALEIATSGEGAQQRYFDQEDIGAVTIGMFYPDGTFALFFSKDNIRNINFLTETAHLLHQSPQREGTDMRSFSRYLKFVDGNGTESVVMLDIFVNPNSIGKYALMSLITVLISLGCFYLISQLLASIALRPVEESWSLQKQFVADASHELKTPLSIIMANTEIIASHPDDTVASQMKWIKNTQTESQKMAELVANLLFLAKHDDGLVVPMTEVNFSDATGTMSLSYEVKYYENSKIFDYDIDFDVKVIGNEQRLKQLVTILLDNANKYSTGAGNIKLELYRENKSAVLKVSNDSVTLEEEQLKHLFDRFYTADQSRNKAGTGGGNGLGLAIAKLIAENHNGEIEVESMNERTIFTVTLPLIKPPKQGSNPS